MTRSPIAASRLPRTVSATKTALARAIVHNPKNVLLDEPTNGLDVMSTRAVREIIRRLKREGTGAVSSHVMQEVSALCDPIVVIARGKIVPRIAG